MRITEEKTLEDLPNELLRNILEYLDPLDVKNSALVSRRWYQIISTGKITDKLTLNLEKCYIKRCCEPITTFTNASATCRRQFWRVNLGRGVAWRTDREATHQVLQNIGRYTKHLSLLVEHFGVPNLLSNFPELRELHIVSTSWRCRRHIPTIVPPATLKRVVFDYVPLKILARSLGMFQRLLDTPKLEVIVKGVIYRQYYKKRNPKLTEFLTMDSQIVSYLDRKIEQKVSYVKILPLNIRERRHVRLADVLNMELPHDIVERDLLQLENYQEMFFSIRHAGCFYHHQVRKYPKVKRLFLHLAPKSETCVSCFKCIAESYPNLTFLEVSLYSVKPLLESLNLSYLESATFNKGDFSAFETLSPSVLAKFANLKYLKLHVTGLNCQTLDMWPQMMKLREISLTFDDEIVDEESCEVLDKFAKLCPLVNKAFIGVRDAEMPLGIEFITIAFKNWPCITDFDMFGIPVNGRELVQLCREIAPYARWLKKIELGFLLSWPHQLTEKIIRRKGCEIFGLIPSLQSVFDVFKRKHFCRQMHLTN